MTEQGDTMAAARQDNDEAIVAAVRRNDDEAAMTATEQNNGEAAMAVEKHDDDDEMGNRGQEGTIPAGATSVETLTADKTGATTGTIEAETCGFTSAHHRNHKRWNEKRSDSTPRVNLLQAAGFVLE